MTKYFIGLLALISISLTHAQRQITEIAELKVSTFAWQEMMNGENNAINYHKTINQAFSEILSGQPLEGLTNLKPALYSTYQTLSIDWFMSAVAYAMLNEKQGVELMLNEALSRDAAIDSLMRTPLPHKLFGGFLGEKAWKEFLKTDRTLNKTRHDWALIEKLLEIEALEIEVEQLEQEYKDSILVHHKNDKEIIEKHKAMIADSKRNLDKVYTCVIDTDAWPFTRMRNMGQRDALIIYEDTPDWHKKNEQRLIILLHGDKLLPWEFAFIHDYHAKRHNLPQKYALFYGNRLDDKAKSNCNAIGMPWGAVRDFRMYYLLPENL